MRILLDENLPAQLKREIRGHEVATVRDAGWAGVKNGRLLDLAQGNFDVLLTADRGIQYQQNLRGRELAIMVLLVSNTKLTTLRPLIPLLIKVLEEGIAPGQVVNIGS